MSGARLGLESLRLSRSRSRCCAVVHIAPLYHRLLNAPPALVTIQINLLTGRFYSIAASTTPNCDADLCKKASVSEVICITINNVGHQHEIIGAIIAVVCSGRRDKASAAVFLSAGR